MSPGVAVGSAGGVSVDISVDVRRGFLGQVRGSFLGRGSVGVSVRVALGASPDVSVGDRGFPWYAVGTAEDIAVDIAETLPWTLPWRLPSKLTKGLHRVLLLAVAFRGSSWNVSGSPWEVRAARGVPAVIRGTPWTLPLNVVEVRGYRRGAPPK